MNQLNRALRARRALLPEDFKPQQGVVPIILHREPKLCAKTGFAQTEAIQTATIVPTHVMTRDKETGTIEAGKFADSS